MAEVPSVAIGWIDAGTTEGLFTDTLAELVKKHPDSQIIHLKSGANISASRNMLVAEFLHGDKEWLLMVDSDMVLRSDLLERMFEYAFPGVRPVIGALCFGFGADGFFPTLYMKNAAGDYDRLENWRNVANGGREIGATGAACLLVHRGVFEKLREVHPGDRPWFAEEQSPSGRWRGEDITFCDRVTSAGFKINVLTQLSVGHVKKQVIDEAFYVRWVEHHRLVVACTPRTGSTYLYQLLRHLGIGAGHEVVYTTVEPQPWALRRAEVSWMATPHLERFQGTVAHLVRNPLDVLNSFLGIGFFHQLDAHIAWTEYIRRQGIRLDEDDPVGSAQRFIIEWNRQIEPWAAKRIKVEDVGVDEIRWLMLQLDSRPPVQTIRWALDGVDKKTNSRTKATLGWDACTPAFRRFAREYGYDTN